MLDACVCSPTPALLRVIVPPLPPFPSPTDPFLGFEEVQVLAGDEAGRHALEAAGAAQAVAG